MDYVVNSHRLFGLVNAAQAAHFGLTEEKSETNQG